MIVLGTSHNKALYKCADTLALRSLSTTAEFLISLGLLLLLHWRKLHMLIKWPILQHNIYFKNWLQILGCELRQMRLAAGLP